MPFYSREPSPRPATQQQQPLQQPLQHRPAKCTYKICVESHHTDTQHLMRRHTDVPYYFRHKNERVKFRRTGKEGDEERPYLCACQQIFHEQNVLAEHLFGTCKVYGTPLAVERMSQQSCVKVDQPHSYPHHLQQSQPMHYVQERLFMTGKALSNLEVFFLCFP